MAATHVPVDTLIVCAARFCLRQDRWEVPSYLPNRQHSQGNDKNRVLFFSGSFIIMSSLINRWFILVLLVSCSCFGWWNHSLLYTFHCQKKPCVLNKVNRGRQSVCRGPSSNRPPHRSTQIQDKESESDLTTEMDRADLRHVVLWRVLMTTTSYVHLTAAVCQFPRHFKPERCPRSCAYVFT